MTMRSNKAIVNAAGQTITTAGLAAGGALNPEQAKKFIQQTFEATPLSGLVRHELRSAKTGEIDKIGVSRLLRKKTENTDDGYRSGVKHGKLEYACTPVRLPWEIHGGDPARKHRGLQLRDHRHQPDQIGDDGLVWGALDVFAQGSLRDFHR